MTKYKELVKQTFELAKQFGRFIYPDHNIDWERVELVERHHYKIPPSQLGRKLLDHDEALSELARLSIESSDTMHIEFDPHLNPTIHDIHPDETLPEEA